MIPSSLAFCARMATVIRTDPTGWRCAKLLGAVTIFLSPAYGEEAEIHFSTGPDGIEIFSNLPRGPVVMPGAPARPLNGQAVLVATQSAQLPEVSSEQGSDIEALGKSFLQDD
jgi:hypothetical protein